MRRRRSPHLDHTLIMPPSSICPDQADDFDPEVFEFFETEMLNFKQGRERLTARGLFGAARERFGDRRVIGIYYSVH